MTHGRGRALRLVGVIALASACAQPPPPSLPPAPPTIQLVGMLAESRVADPERTYVLDDGREIEISTAETRVVFEGGPGHPFVQGIDARGPFVASFSGQEGRPADCHIIPANGGNGVERGAFIELEGILWRKDAAFASEVGVPPVGQRYEDVGAFCFNEDAEIMTAVEGPEPP